MKVRGRAQPSRKGGGPVTVPVAAGSFAEGRGGARGVSEQAIAPTSSRARIRRTLRAPFMSSPMFALTLE
jgi:hypothetical protein